jgi:hypothetical protein
MDFNLGLARLGRFDFFFFFLSFVDLRLQDWCWCLLLPALMIGFDFFAFYESVIH